MRGGNERSNIALSVTHRVPPPPKVEALNVDGDEILLEAEGFLAIVLSHEIDHLDGILYKDKAFEFGKAAKR